MRKIIIFAVLMLALISIFIIYEPSKTLKENLPQRFSSYNELKEFVKAGQQADYGIRILEAGVMKTTAAEAVPAPAGAASEYSTTNIQVEGVDEADIVKNDGKYIYTVSGNKVIIIDAYPAENAQLLSEIKLDGNPTELFVNDDKLIVFGRSSYYTRPYYYSQNTFIYVYDISDRQNPVLVRNLSINGDYFDSRMIDDYVYVIINQPTYLIEEEVNLPVIAEDGTEKTVPASEIYYFPIPQPSYQFTNIIALNTQDDNEEISKKVFMIGYSQNMYVSQDNIYLTYTKWPVYPLRTLMVEQINEKVTEPKENTVIHKVTIYNGNIEYKTNGEVPGNVLNQFSMDEYNNNFRIATTTGEWSSTSKNNVYILDEELSVIGKLEDLAPGENIYSARFIGNRAYLVTFKKVDPLFVIDLSEPTNPKVLGKLKIPGYSDYLHPYDENHIIGIGKEAVEAEEGDFAWYQGVKLSLFDVSDVENPKEISKIEIGDRGTDSYALQDHKAFLFSKSKNLLVIPILLAEIDEEKYPQGIEKWAYGDFVFQGAYVYDLTLENGFQFKGRITHIEDDSLLKSGYYYESSYSIKRTLYMDSTLYTISDKTIKMNDLEDLEEINKLSLPYEKTSPEYPYEVIVKTI